MKNIYDRRKEGLCMEIVRKKEEEENRLFLEFQEMIDYHMKEIQQCLMTAGKLFYDCEEEEEQGRLGREIVESAVLKECVGCHEKYYCHFTMEDKDRLGKLMEAQGGLSVANFRSCHSCRREQDFVDEINRIYERELFLESLRRGVVQLQRMVGRQYMEAGKMLGKFSEGGFHLSKENQDIYEKIFHGFAKSSIKVREIYFYENHENGKQIYLFLKKKRGKEMTSRQAAALLSDCLQRKMQLIPGQKKIIGNRYEMLGFTPAVKFHILGGIVTKPAIEGQTNGDSFSMGNIGERKYVAMISDGMGVGKEAGKQSRKTIEMLEELLGVGMKESQAICLLRSMSIFQQKKDQYATLDYFQMDLSAGVGTFLKIGACPSFFKRKGKVEVLEMEELIAGLPIEEELPFYRKKMESEDLLVQLSDGVLDSIGEDATATIVEYMKEICSIRPQAFAEELFEKIVSTDGYEKKDDQTILVLGIWDKY